MNKFKYLILAIAITTSVDSHAGFKSLTWHSRANCITINESITWEFGKNQWLKTVGYHYYKNAAKANCDISDGWQYTWRSASIHWTEGHGGWQVCGDHYTKNEKGDPVYIAQTCAKDCNLYDGWWDQSPPPKKDTPPAPRMLYGDDRYLPKTGIHIVDVDLSLPKEIRSIKTDMSDRVKELLTMGKPDYKDWTEPYETGLKPNLGTIRLGFKYDGIKPLEFDGFRIIGYAVQGTFIDQKGWTGISEYFLHKDLGVCYYLVEDVALTRGGINLQRDQITYDINGKPTEIMKWPSLTMIKWYSDNYYKTLECATNNPQAKKLMLAIAKEND